MQQYTGLFLYGLSTFMTPCSIGLITAYLTYTLRGVESKSRGAIIGLSFMAAMGLVFFTIGYAVSSLIPVNLSSSKFIYLLAGVLLILFGLSSLGAYEKIGALSGILARLTEGSNTLRLNAIRKLEGTNVALNSFLFGVFISIALGPCSLALVLPAVMMTIFNASSPIHGGLQLLAFGLGHSLPVLMLSVLIPQTRYMLSTRLAVIGDRLTKVLGIGLISIGIWIILDALKFI